jgi:hypothetical protein
VREVSRATELVGEVITSLDEEILEDRNIVDFQEPPQMMIFHKRKPSCATDLIQYGEKYGVPEGTTRQVKIPNQILRYQILCIASFFHIYL